MKTYILIFKPKRYNIGKNPVRRLLQEFGCKMIQFPVINKHKVIKFQTDKPKEELDDYIFINSDLVDKIELYEVF